MNVGDLSKLLSAIAQIMQALKMGVAGGGSQNPANQNPNFGNYPVTTGGCTQYYQVSTPSPDPCAYYVPPTSASIQTNTNFDTGGADNGISAGTPSIDLISSLLNPVTPGAAPISVGSSTSNIGGLGVTASSSREATSTSLGGVSGDIRVLPSGATIVVSSQSGSSSVVAGFLGKEAGGGAEPQGLVANWCRTRPWAANFLSLIIPPVFFDSLCAFRGYKVGEVRTQPPSVILSQTRLKAPQATSTQEKPMMQVPPGLPMQVDIWAVPPAVPLGARTTIFWNSRGAATCTETSPDGSFSHNTLSGGGATVPLSGPTTFTISCQAPDGTHATGYVTVNLSV